MKRLLITTLIAGALAVEVQAGDGEPQRFDFGLSYSVAEPERAPETRRKLDRQSASGAGPESELSVQAYVDSQERIAETFRQPIPERIGENTRGER